MLAQRGNAHISGSVLGENEEALIGVSVTILGRSLSVATGDSGKFKITVPADRAFALIFSFTGYKSEQINFLLNEGEEENITVYLERGETVMEEVVVTDQRDRRETGVIRPNPKSVINLPAPVMGVESLIKVFVGSNNELTSQYSVRGGSYDENLIYVNDFEIYRPYLVRSGQQEGLSFINPEMVQNIKFYNGGFPAIYGDKMSSVLDIRYKTPRKFGGSAYLSILEQGVHLEGAAANSKLGYLIGVRNRSNRNLLSRQETEGSYVPSSSDIQALVQYRFNSKWELEFLGNISRTRFQLAPAYSQLTSSVFSPFFAANLGLDIYFQGNEKDEYVTAMTGLATTWKPVADLRLKFLVSRFQNEEIENIDIAGAYLFGERDFDRGSQDFGLIVNPLGAGMHHQFARNKLNLRDWSFAHKGAYDRNQHHFLWGLTVNNTLINDRLHEWEYQDSAGYSLPYNPDMLELNKLLRATAHIEFTRFSGYLQDNIAWGDSLHSFTLQGGMRFQYNTLNKEFFLAPRVSASWKPAWKRDIILRAALGAYHQPPFYRELRRYDGSLNTNMKAQKSWQAVMGFDYNFQAFGRVLRLTTEAYYKKLSDVVPYDVDNLRIRYTGANEATAWATGIEMRLFGEIVPDAESWISFGWMRTRENLDNDFYKEYILDSFNNPIDSVTVAGGWYRRPTDRALTFGMFFQDYLSTNKNFRVYLSTLYGSNLPYNIPNNVKYRNALIIEPYLRIDIGFSALLLDADRGNRRSKSPFRQFENIWASLEVFNLIDRRNTISYMLIKDFSNNIFTVPNRLTPRLVNFKIVARW